MIRLAFLFRVEVGKDIDPSYVVKITSCHTYRIANVEWMDDVNLPQWKSDDIGGTLEPDVDMTVECHKFTNEATAIRFMAGHYRSELTKSVLKVEPSESATTE